MAIPTFYFNLIVYIYANADLAERNHSLGGTGFLFGVESKDNNGWFLYVVTNRHVIENIKELGVTDCGIRINTKDGKTDVVSVPIDSWTYHPKGDDLAVSLLNPSDQWKYDFITEDWLIEEAFIRGDIFGDRQEPDMAAINWSMEGLEKKWQEVRKIGIGDETVTIGRFIKHDGSTRNYPVVRRGHISMLPFEPIKQRGRSFMQDSFMVETYSIGGFSGSPVFIQTQRNDRHKSPTSNGTTYHDKVYLLGVDWGHFDFEGELIDPVTGNAVKTPSGMMCVVPAWKLNELFNTMELGMQRKDLDKELKKKSKQGAAPDSNLTKEEFEEVLKKVSKKLPKNSKYQAPSSNTRKKSSDSS